MSVSEFENGGGRGGGGEEGGRKSGGKGGRQLCHPFLGNYRSLRLRW